MFKTQSLLLILLLLTASSCWRQAAGDPAAQNIWQTLEYYQRWRHSEFEARHAWFNQLLPAAWAELPPEHQRAFALRLQKDPASGAVSASYHFQKVLYPESHQHHSYPLTASEQATLNQLLSKPVSCLSTVEPGWVGPAPKQLLIDFGAYEEWLFVGGPEGPAGPGSSLYQQNQRRYLCQPGLLSLLSQILGKAQQGLSQS